MLNTEQTNIGLPLEIKKMAKQRARELFKSLSEHIKDLILEDLKDRK